MSQHYFIGIPIPSLVYNYAQDVMDRHQLSNIYRVVPHLQDLHITLSFLGSVKEEQLTALTNQLAAIALRHHSLELAVNGASHFGAIHQPSVIYLSVDKNKPLYHLQTEIAQTVAGLLHTEISTKPFIPHITVAKKLRDAQRFSFTDETISPIQFSAPLFSLYQIQPNQTPKYHAIENFRLSKKDKS